MTTVEIQQQFAANFYGVAHVMQGRVASPNCFPSPSFSGLKVPRHNNAVLNPQGVSTG